MINEVWKPIEGTEGLYEVSNTGKIRSLNYRMTGKVHEIDQQLDHKGYLRVRVKNKGFPHITFKVHREVARAFIPNNEGKKQVNHINGDKTDNRVENLEWVSLQENAAHAMENGLWENNLRAIRESNERKKVPIIATNIETGKQLYFSSMSDAERALGTKHINAVIRGERKQAAGFRFEYAKGGDAHATSH